jgi:lactoylglutathione lyase
MGCEEIGRTEACLIGDVQLTFFEREPSGGSVGTGVDHIGVSFEDLEARMAGWREAGVTILSDVRAIDGLFKLAFLEDPWGTKIEVVEDHEDLGFHHVHLMTPDPEATLTWYREMFGGEADRMKGRLDGVRFGRVWLLASRLRGGDVAPTRGRAIDHLGWDYADLDAAAADMEGRGAEFSMQPRPYTNPLGIEMRISFLTGPDDVLIEVVQRPSFRHQEPR